MSQLLAEAQRTLSEFECVFYCVGAQKGGTTWLHAQLARHPAVHFTRKEYGYWNTICSPFGISRQYPWGPLYALPKLAMRPSAKYFTRFSSSLEKARLNWRAIQTSHEDHRDYAALLAYGAKGARIVGDVTPNSLLGRRTFAAMASLHPNSRFLFIMRDPVDRLWSGVRHRTRAWSKQPDGAQLAIGAFENAISDPQHADLLRSEYARTVQELEAAIPPERLLFLFYETLFTEAQADRIRAFLNLPDARLPPEERVHVGAAHKERPSEEQLDRAHRMLAETYEFIHDRFGDEVPSRWRKPPVRP